MDISSQVNLWTQRLRAIAQTGLAFEPSLYDRERYDELLRLAADMAATNELVQPNEQLSRELVERWRAEIRLREKGYITPQVGVGAAVFNERDEVLLIQRASGHWLYPTGWADVGYAAAQVVAKEVLEETGLRVTPVRLIAVYDSSRRDPPILDAHWWSLAFYCRLDGGTLTRHPLETLDAGFFARDQLPTPLVRQGKPWLDHAFAAHRGEMREAYFEWP